MRDIEEDKHEIISGYVLANKRILNQEQLLLGVLRKKKGWKEQVIGIDKRRQRELAGKGREIFEAEYWKATRRVLKGPKNRRLREYLTRETEELRQWEVGNGSQPSHSYTCRMIFVANIGSYLLGPIISF